MKKQILALSLLSLALSSCGNPGSGSPSSSSSSENPSSDESVPSSLDLSSEEGSEESSEEESPIEIEKTDEFATSLCLGTTRKDITFPTTFFSVAEDVPYLRLDMFAMLFTLATGRRVLEADESSTFLTNTSTDVTILFDAKKNTISTEDLDQATNYSGTPAPNDPLLAKNDVIATLDREKTTYAKGKSMAFHMDDFKAKIVEYDGAIYAPFAYLSAIFLTNAKLPIAFNGDNYYLIDKGAMTEKEEDGKTVLSSYGESFYEGSLAKKETRSESYANYFYYSFVFQMTYFNGKTGSLGIGDLDAKLNELGLKEKMLSRDSKKADEALALAVSEIFHDGGHTAFVMRGMTCPFDVDENKRLFSFLDTYDSRYKSTNEAYETMESLRGEGKGFYEVSGSTAVIRLDSFDATEAFIGRGQTAYPDLSVLEEDYQSANPSTFALLYFTFQKIEEESAIKNVVFDVTMNGGGDMTALGYALSFLTDDPIEISFKNTVTGATYTEACSYDNDLNPDTEKDSYQGKYDFYILTSSYSFSCANAFPCIAKDEGLATIIGERSGGGDCAATGMTSIEGSFYQTSGNPSIRRKDGTDVDDGQAVDRAYPMSDFYDVAKIDAFLKTSAS